MYKSRTACKDSVTEDNIKYWTGRAPGYSRVNREELAGGGHERWKACLQQELENHFVTQSISGLKVLEVGTGPGFFAILLSELGLQVTAIDLTPAMLDQARENAGSRADRIRFAHMDAQNLEFEDDKFDVVISRNLTWNLPCPDQAYAEWARVLKPDGLFLNFDANWYAYLFDERARKAYEEDRMKSVQEGIEDQNVGENFDRMEEIARQIPLSGIHRPEWDREVLKKLGMKVCLKEDIWQQVWSDAEKVNFASTPMFMVKAIHKGPASRGLAHR